MSLRHCSSDNKITKVEMSIADPRTEEQSQESRLYLCLRHHFLILLLASLLLHLHGHAGRHVHQVRSHQISVHIHIREVTLYIEIKLINTVN